jgi:hypothetical protein
MCVNKLIEGVSLLTHKLNRPISALCVSISFYEGDSLLTHRKKSPISALCVSISFYEGDSLLTHRLAPGLFCNPFTKAILKHFKNVNSLGFLWQYD